MKERKSIFKKIGYLLMILTLTIVTFTTPRFIEKEVVNATTTRIEVDDYSNDPNGEYTIKLEDEISQVSVNDGPFESVKDLEYTATLTIEDADGTTLNGSQINKIKVDMTNGDKYLYNVVWDTWVGTLFIAKIKSSNSNPTIAVDGDILTVTVQGWEAIQTPIVSIGGQRATVRLEALVDGEKRKYTTTHTVNETTQDGSLSKNLIISYMDLAGNSRIKIGPADSKNVVIVTSTPDTTPPTLPTVTIESDNDDPTLAEVGDTITLTIKANESIKKPMVKIAGQSATVSGYLDEYTATYEVKAGIDKGIAKIEIQYEDLAGNGNYYLEEIATANSRTVITSIPQDNIIPELDTVTIKSDNDDLTLAKIGDIITLTILANEDIQDLIVTIAGQTAIVTGSGMNYTATYTVVAGTLEGVAGISIRYNDLAMNVGVEVTGTTDDSKITIDKTALTLDTVTIASDNDDNNTAFAKVGDTITLTIVAKEDIQDLTVSIAGQSIIPTGSGMNYTATYTVVAGTPEGVAEIKIAYADLAGNVGTLVTATLNSTTVTVDKIASTLQTVTIVANNNVFDDPAFAKVGDTIMLKIVAKENIQEPTVTIAGQSIIPTGSGMNYTATYTVVAGTPEGEVAFSITYKDLAGNPGSDLAGNADTAVTGTTDDSKVTVDKTAPTLLTVTITSDNGIVVAEGDEITLSMIASEDLQLPTVTIAGQLVSVTGSGDTYEGTYIVKKRTPEGEARITISYTDEAGNRGIPVTVTTDLSTVTVDKTLPKLDIVTIASNNSNTALAKGLDVITVSITASEDIKTLTVEVAGKIANVTGSGKIYTATYTVAVGTPEGVAGINITYVDLAGNAGTVVTATTNSSVVTVDKTKPTLNTVTIRSNNNNTALAKVGDEISVTIIANENIQTPTVTIAGQAATISGSGDTYTATYLVDENTPEGSAGINIIYTDEAGNAGTAVTATTDSNTVRIHTSAQSLPYVGIASNNRYNTELAKVGDIVTLTIRTNEYTPPTVTIAGETTIVRNIYGQMYAATYRVVEGTSEGAVVFNITYTDEVGNAGTVTATTDLSTVTVDKTPPTSPTVTIKSDNANPIVAIEGNIITVTITARENIQIATVTIAGEEAIISGSGDTYIATYTVVAGTPKGEVEINITYADEAGNSGAVVTATTDSSTVTVDLEGPRLEEVTIESDNPFNTALAKVGDTITVSITANESIQTPIVTIAGQPATVTGSEDKYTAKYTVVEGTPEGEAGINITYTDEAGHAGTLVTATTNSSKVIVDITESILPTLPRVTIESNNQSNKEFAKVGDTITVSIMASRNIQTPIVIIAGTPATVTGSGYTYVATYTVEEETTEGVAGINITYVDEAGNTGIPVTATTNSSTVTVEKAVPTLSTVRIVSNNVNHTEYAIVKDTIMLSITVSKKIETPTITIAGQVATVIGSEDTYTAFYMIEEGTAEGIVPFNITYTDGAGNAATVTATTDSSTVTIVKIVSIELAVTIKSDNEFNTALAKVGDLITLTIIADQKIEIPTVTIAGQTATVTGSEFTYTATYTVVEGTPEGVAEISITYVDEEGNAITETATTDSSTVIIDKKVPQISTIAAASDRPNAPSQATIGDTITVSIVVDEEIHTPVIKIAGNIATVTGSGTNYTAIYMVKAGDQKSENQLTEVIVLCADMAGNQVSIVEHVQINIFNTELSVSLTTVTIESNNNNQNLAKLGDTITVSMKADNNIMLQTVTIAGQPATVTGSGDTYEATYTIVAETPEGEAGISITYVDVIMNISVKITRTTNLSVVTIDKTAPVINPVTGVEVDTENVATWIAPLATIDDADADISDDIVVTYYKADGTTLLTNLIAIRKELREGRDVVVKYNVSDAAGNNAIEVSATFRVIRRGIPTIIRGNWTLAQEYVFTANESIVEYSLDGGGGFIAIGLPVGDEYTITIGDDLPHQLVLKDTDGNKSDTLPIEAKATGSDNAMFYASKGLLPWEYDTEAGDGIDSNWDYAGTGLVTPDLLDANGNCNNEYGEGAYCYKIYDLDVDGEQVKVLQQLDDSNNVILEMIREVDVDDYNNLLSNGGSIRGRVILPTADTYAGIGDPNTQNYAGNSQAVDYGAHVKLQFEMNSGVGEGHTRFDKRYMFNVTYAGEYVKIQTPNGDKVLNGNWGYDIGNTQWIKLPMVRVGDPLDFELRIPIPPVRLLSMADIYINGIYIGKTGFYSNNGGPKDNKVSISSGSTGGTNRAILIENFGIQINTGAIDVLVPISGGADVVDNPLYTFESNEEVSGYQINDESWVTVEPTFQITDILLSEGQNDLRVRDISGNIDTYNIVVDTTILSE